MSNDEGLLAAGELGISAPQAAQAIGVSPSTIYRWSDQGYLESYRTPSGQRRFSREGIDEFIAVLERQQLEPMRDRRTG
jgi:excisionase family DNA binding protein